VLVRFLRPQRPRLPSLSELFVKRSCGKRVQGSVLKDRRPFGEA